MLKQQAISIYGAEPVSVVLDRMLKQQAISIYGAEPVSVVLDRLHAKILYWNYRKVSNIRRTKSQNLNASRLIL